MAFDAFLKLDGIQGESTDDKHKDQIEILSFSWGATQPTSGSRSSGGAPSAERVNIHDFSIVKTLDKASPKLFLFCASGKHVKEATFVLARATGDKQKYMEYKMTDVIVSSVRPGGSAKGGDALPLEEVSFNFGKIELTYTATDHKTGKSAGDVKANWDQVANKGS
jgi:type VI secretion system secreted protein Hcp